MSFFFTLGCFYVTNCISNCNRISSRSLNTGTKITKTKDTSVRDRRAEDAKRKRLLRKNESETLAKLRLIEILSFLVYILSIIFLEQQFSLLVVV